MKKIFIIANWKSNKTIKETEEWFHSFSDGFKRDPFSLENKEIIVSPSFTLLEHANYCSGNLKLPIKFAAQTISPFEEGAYTGEVNGKQIKELVDYVVVGHSERRQNFGEDQDMIDKKTQQTLKYELVPILCISNIQQTQSAKLKAQNYNSKLKSYKILVAYEPLFAIGSGHPDTPENADNFAQKIKKELGKIPVLYGGSVTGDNVNSLTQMNNIDGVLVGGASLDPRKFLEIVKNA